MAFLEVDKSPRVGLVAWLVFALGDQASNGISIAISAAVISRFASVVTARTWLTRMGWAVSASCFKIKAMSTLL
jgi:hypothetical protein